MTPIRRPHSPQLEPALTLMLTMIRGPRSNDAPALPTAGGVESSVPRIPVEWGPWVLESGGSDPREDLEGWRRLEEMAPLASPEHWTRHPPLNDLVELRIEAGDHRWRLEYIQIDGATALSMTLRDLAPNAGFRTSP